MRENELKEALTQITMSNKRKEEIISKLTKQKNESTFLFRIKGIKKIKVAVFCILVTGMVAFPVKAVVSSLVKERMNQVPVQEMESIARELNNSNANADTLSRDLKQEELDRLNELFKEYHNGTFPTGKITEIESEKQVNPESICFLPATQTYYFPKREMTDEELLQYIDFQFKRTYALEQNLDEDIKAQQKEREEAQKDKIQTIEASGGISLEEASRIGGKWLQTLFQVNKDGLEKNCYLMDTSDMDTAVTNKYPNVYMSYYGTMHEHYYFHIDAATGALVAAEQSMADSSKDVPQDLFQSNIQSDLESAKSILEKMIGVNDDFTNIYCSYALTQDDNIKYGVVSFHFVKEDETDYIVKINVDTKELVSFSDVYQETQEQTRERLEQIKEFNKKVRGDEYEEITYHRIELK